MLPRKSLTAVMLVASACATAPESAAEPRAATPDESRPRCSIDTQLEVNCTPADGGTSAMRLAYPATRTQVVHESIHGVDVADPYRWLEDEKAPEVQTWMKAQDTLARRTLEALPGRDALKTRLTELMSVHRTGVPIKAGGRYFYSHLSKGQEKAVIVWREGEKGEEHIALDPNTWSNDNTVSLGEWVPSWDGKKIAFTEKPNAADEATLFVLDLASSKRSEIDIIEGAKYAAPSWAADSKSFMYTFLPLDPAIPVAARPGYAEVRLHVVGQDPKRDTVVRERTGDAQTFVSGQFSRDGQFQLIELSRGWTENTVWFKRLATDKTFTVLVEGKDATYAVEPYKGRFYVLTDEGAPYGQVFVVDPAAPARANWKLVLPQESGVTRESISIFGGELVIRSLSKAVSVVEVFSLKGKKLREVALPGLGTVEGPIGESDSDEMFMSFSSFTDPMVVLQSSVRTGQTRQWAKVEVPVDASKYEVKQVSYPSKDGTLITMFVVASKNMKLDGTTPVFLTGYGGFAAPMRSSFTGWVYPWLEAGGVFVMTNLRGGSEYGKAWHDAGRLANKQNVFDDFEAAAKYLVEQKYTSPARLAIRGRSNGGLLMGAAMTQHPERYGAVICGVPLMDMVRFHLVGSGATWVPEYGSPEKAEEFKVLEAYSPYHQVKDGVVYPPLLMLSTDHDDRVDPMHARKFVARVQKAEGGKGVALLRIDKAAGHLGSDQISREVDLWVDIYAFLFQQLGVSAQSN